MASVLDLLRGREVRENLPRYRDAFVGRKLPMERLGNALDNDRVAVVVGPPGVGKSRLSQEHGWRFLQQRPAASAWFADLTAARDDTEAIAEIGRTLGLQFGSGTPTDEAIDRIGAALSSLGPALLIVDNAEAHIELASRCVGEWLDAAEQCRLLVTSRRKLPDHDAIDLHPLGSVAALELLEDRLAHFRGSYVPTEATRDGLLDLAGRLDGLPLALELIAPRLRLLSPAQILERLDTTGGALDAALQRSWEMLEHGEQAAFMQTSVFRGGFGAAAAEALLDIDAPLRALDALLEHSLLRTRTTREFPDEPRLHYPVAVREFAARMLVASDEEDDVRERHIEYFVEHGEAWDDGIDTGDEVESTRRLIVELPNLLAAWEHAGGEARVRLGLVLHMALQRGGPFDRQFEITDDAVAGAHELDDDFLLGRALLNRSRAQRWKNDFEASLDDLRAALEHARKADDFRTTTSALRNLAAGHWGRGELDKTREYADEALQVSLGNGSTIDEVNSLNGLGFLLAHTGELDAAQDHLERALSLARELDHAPGLEALVCSSLGALMSLRGSAEQAEYYCSRALELYEELDYVRSIPLELLGRAEARALAGSFDAARDDVAETLSLADRVGYRLVKHRAGYVATLVELLAGEYPRALDLALKSSASLSEAGDRVLILGAKLQEVIARSMLDQPAKAASVWDEAMAMAEDLSTGRWSELARITEAYLFRADLPDNEAVASIVALLDGPDESDAIAAALAMPLRAELPDDAADALLFTADGRQFRLPGDEPVDITRRKALRGILALLVELRSEKPGEHATHEEVLEAGWPGETMTPESGAQRVYVTIKRLRDLGLDDVLVTAGDGYMLDPNVAVRVVESI